MKREKAINSKKTSRGRPLNQDSRLYELAHFNLSNNNSIPGFELMDRLD